VMMAERTARSRIEEKRPVYSQTRVISLRTDHAHEIVAQKCKRPTEFCVICLKKRGEERRNAPHPTTP